MISWLYQLFNKNQPDVVVTSADLKSCISSWVLENSDRAHYVLSQTPAKYDWIIEKLGESGIVTFSNDLEDHSYYRTFAKILSDTGFVKYKLEDNCVVVTLNKNKVVTHMRKSK